MIFKKIQLSKNNCYYIFYSYELSKHRWLAWLILQIKE